MPAVDVVVVEPASFVEWYLANVGGGPAYYGRSDLITGDGDAVGLADLGWAVLLGGGPRWQSARSLVDQGPVDISAVPLTGLHETSLDDRETIVDALMKLVQLD